jgi:hypothetical protein
MNRIIILLLFPVFLISGCASTSGFEGRTEASLVKQADLLSFSLDNRFIYFDVISNGCTLIGNFEVALADKESNSIEVIQKKADLCKVKPIKVSMAYTFRHLGVDTSRPIKVLNKISKKTTTVKF